MILLKMDVLSGQKAQEEHGKKMEDEMHSLFKFAQGVAHLWDVHEIGLAKQERALQEKLEECRHEHDFSNQVSPTYTHFKTEDGIVSLCDGQLLTFSIQYTIFPAGTEISFFFFRSVDKS